MTQPTASSPQKAVVIGGAGFLGQRLVACLLGDVPDAPAGWPRFETVHVFDTAPFAPRQAPSDPSRVTSAVGDIRSREDLRKAIAGAHTVFHLASLVDVGLKKNPLIDAVNVEGTRNVVEVAQELGVPFLVYTSSEDVVLTKNGVTNGDESLPYPDVLVHDYVRTKIEGERVVRQAHGKRGLSTCAIRPVHIYGPHDPHAIKVSITELASGKVPFLMGDGSALFDVVYVDNVVHGHLLAASRLHDPSTRESVGGKAYFVGEGNAINYFEFIRPYAAARGVSLPKLRLPYMGVELVARGMELVHRVLGVDVPFHRFHLYILCKDFYFTNAQAERDLGYTPWVSPKEALARTIEWIKVEPLDLPARARA
ncbi:MAG: NAD-dependent epimerase/dehydratase family protein [Sandaracinaceae bacterium]|nr:NAD-dependent epimerase/dehydratase family protein [Sandaracinaceae bacterium]MBK6811669.1 NAD-dependent epimerase/dehydratase family protein [Sandaracinaceae bacterium]MBK7150473.1 NAD-dependent epimerase/dehydratase family protein [Sandaracinaceae bacterium]MBK7777699.1 NAD-dependent epimerase/dehydratase family protein [Sandaracinaceae bacterium]MBK8408687.1 NAD-dependent epimerase/dehydratase family protein [Sandaracinaceae bacterium]